MSLVMLASAEIGAVLSRLRADSLSFFSGLEAKAGQSGAHMWHQIEAVCRRRGQRGQVT
jgi:hypothetical protein